MCVLSHRQASEVGMSSTDDARARLLALVEKWRRLANNAHPMAISRETRETLRQCADELAALLPPVGQPANPLQSELLDLIKLMPDSQVDEILSFVGTLREAKGLAKAPVGQPSQYGSEVLCEDCAKVFCPHGERGHFFHDGCPQCDATEASVGQEAPPGWQPIETAPRDGTCVIGLDTKDGVGRTHWSEKYNPHCWADDDELLVKPTHWMPLPAAPLPSPASPPPGGKLE
jgi:hypothetical protein